MNKYLIIYEPIDRADPYDEPPVPDATSCVYDWDHSFLVKQANLWFIAKHLLIERHYARGQLNPLPEYSEWTIEAPTQSWQDMNFGRYAILPYMIVYADNNELVSLEGVEIEGLYTDLVDPSVRQKVEELVKERIKKDEAETRKRELKEFNRLKKKLRK